MLIEKTYKHLMGLDVIEQDCKSSLYYTIVTVYTFYKDIKLKVYSRIVKQAGETRERKSDN